MQHLVVGADASKDPAVPGPVQRDDRGGVTGTRRRGREPAVDVGEEMHAPVRTGAREEGRVRRKLDRSESPRGPAVYRFVLYAAAAASLRLGDARQGPGVHDDHAPVAEPRGEQGTVGREVQGFTAAR